MVQPRGDVNLVNFPRIPARGWPAMRNITEVADCDLSAVETVNVENIDDLRVMKSQKSAAAVSKLRQSLGRRRESPQHNKKSFQLNLAYYR